MAGLNELTRRRFRLSTIVMLGGAILASTQASAVLPPDTLLLFSGQTVQRAQLPPSIVLPGGVITIAELEMILSGHSLDDETLYVLNTNTASVLSANSQAGLIRPENNVVAVYSPMSGLIEMGIVTDPTQELGSIQVDLNLTSQPSLSNILAEPGSFAVLGGALIPVPEPGFATSLAVGWLLLGQRSRTRRQG